MSRFPLRFMARFALPALFLVSGVACGRATEPTAYVPPATQPGPDGGEAYLQAPIVDRASAASLDPHLGSAEAAVVKFLASRVRGDERWREAMAAGGDARVERALAEWAEWEVQRFQLRRRQVASDDRMLVTAWFEIAVDGDTDEGEDEFELVLADGSWRIVRPPV
jgi:hypothetical protein